MIVISSSSGLMPSLSNRQHIQHGVGGKTIKILARTRKIIQPSKLRLIYGEVCYQIHQSLQQKLMRTEEQD